MAIILPVMTALACGISFLLMLKDAKDQHKEGTEEGSPLLTEDGKPAVSMLVYSGICVLLTVLIAAFFPKLYPDNSVWVSVKRMLLLSIIWPVAYIDFKTLRIPNLFILYGLIVRALVLGCELFGNPAVWITFLGEVIAAVALLLAAFLCGLAVKNGIGFGDMKLFIVMGLLLGLEGIWGAIFLSLLVSFFLAAYVLITKKKTRKDAIPFGPALVVGTYLSICLSGM